MFPIPIYQNTVKKALDFTRHSCIRKAGNHDEKTAGKEGLSERELSEAFFLPQSLYF